MGAELALASPTRPREDDRAGEARVLSPPSPADGGAASDEASGAPFSFFAAGTGLAKEYGRQASTTKQEAKRESSTYSSSLAGSSNLRPNLKPESRLLGSASGDSGAGGTSADRLRAGAGPRRTSPVLSFFGIRGELSPPRSSPSSSSSGMRRRARDLRRGRGSLDSPSVASESGSSSCSSSSVYPHRHGLLLPPRSRRRTGCRPAPCSRCLHPPPHLVARFLPRHSPPRLLPLRLRSAPSWRPHLPAPTASEDELDH